MQTPDYLEIDLSRLVIHNEKFLNILEEVMKLNWLHERIQPEKSELMARTLSSLASRAVENNHFIDLQVLLEHVDVNSEDYMGYTPLHTACLLGNGEMVMFLLDNGAVNRSKHCPLHLAIKNRNFLVIELLRWKGFTVKLHPVRIGVELIQTVRKRDHALLHAWFLSGVDMDTSDYNGWTAMKEAVRLGENTMITKLVHLQKHATGIKTFLLNNIRSGHYKMIFMLFSIVQIKKLFNLFSLIITTVFFSYVIITAEPRQFVMYMLLCAKYLYFKTVCVQLKKESSKDV
ncbi:L-asparaginase-like isoform X2 [Triplophysa dalaica]|uniref:L-asparaginase-like isoform X2 n=1 Tax=Triplophysa dalaica TaxID=1582913 RepID=UPI0024DF8B3A|nr:L-asparaginase-like isoform X2 [Triplophysa dalaica]